jgi:hypothetical protein
MASRRQKARLLITDGEMMMRPSIGEAVVLRNIAFWFRRWREDRQTWAALRYLDDRQLKEFEICPRPLGLTRPKFP